MVNEQQIQCPVCGCEVTEDENLHICDICATPHHKDCWDYAKGCAIFGCRKDLTRIAKGNVSNVSKGTVNLTAMRICSWLFRLHWFAFFLIMAGIILPVPLVGISFVLLLPFLGTGSGVIFNNLLFVGFCSMLALPIGTALYFLLLPPAILMRLYLWKANIQISMSGTAPMPVADTVDMPLTFRGVLLAEKIMKRLIEIIIIPCLIFLVFCLFTGDPPFTVPLTNLAFLLTLRFVAIPAFSIAAKSRMTFLTAFQNRLIASAKQQKR